MLVDADLGFSRKAHRATDRRLGRFLVMFAWVLALGLPVTGECLADSMDVVSATTSGSVVELSTEGGLRVRLSFLTDELFRIQAFRGENPEDEQSGKAPIVVQEEFEGASITLEESLGKRILWTETLKLVMHSSPLRLELHRRSDDQLLWRELKPLSLDAGSTVLTLSSDEQERFYGGGQQNGVFQFKGRSMEISYSGGWEEGDRPSPAPFFMSSRGYGMLRNTWSNGVYDFRSDHYLTAGHEEERLDVYVMVADSIHGVLDLYTGLTGRARLLPRWAYGYGDADCYNDGDNVKKPGTVPEGWTDGPTGTTPDVVESVAEAYRRHNMPGSWILPNDGYGCGYSDLPEVVQKLDDLGFRTGLWTEDGVEKIAWEVGTAGSRVQKLDVAWTGKGYQFAMDANHDAANGILQNSDSRPVLWTVMGWAGIQRYAVTWTGDQSGSWDYIRWHVPTFIGSGLSGMSYSTSDVDGIFGGSPETFTRDLQWKSFTPVLMGMSGWSKAERKHPWWFDEPYRSINRRYLKLRQRLMPYLYTLARDTETHGAPMVRSAVWDYPGPAEDHRYQFFLGQDLLIAPVFRSGDWREGVFLPEGRWIDYWNGTILDAGPEGRSVDVPVDLATIPVFVRAGAILPMYPESLYDGQVPPDPLTLDIYPHGSSEFQLYEDDGQTRQYLEGAFSTQAFRAVTDPGAGSIQVHLESANGSYEGILEQRKIVLRLHVPSPPNEVTLNGTVLPASEDQSSGAGWTFDPEDRGGTLWIQSDPLSIRSPHQVTASFSPGTLNPSGGSYPPMPETGSRILADDLTVIGRPAEEPGHVLENAFDGDPDTWFRTVRDQRLAYGAHELTLSLGGRRLVEGFKVSPRNDKHWKYGQIKDYELYVGDINGVWGEPAARGSLEQVEGEQEVRFPARVGRLLRLRILSTHDDGLDPMVLGAGGVEGGSFDASAPVQVGSTTISELEILERRPPAAPKNRVALAPLVGDARECELNGLSFAHGLSDGSPRYDFELEGHWQTFRAEVGLAGSESSPAGSARFQVWGDERLLWDSGEIKTVREVLKPRVDIRGISRLSLRTVSSFASASEGVRTVWAAAEVEGFEDDSVRSVDIADLGCNDS